MILPLTLVGMLVMAAALGFMMFTQSRPRAAIIWAFVGFFVLFGGLVWFETRNRLAPGELLDEFDVVPQVTATISRPSEPDREEVLGFLEGFDGQQEAMVRVGDILPSVIASEVRVWIVDSKLDPEEVMTYHLIDAPSGWGFTEWSTSHVRFVGHGEEALVAIEKRSNGSRVAYILPAEPWP